jgi:hypothetical protein
MDRHRPRGGCEYVPFEVVSADAAAKSLGYPCIAALAAPIFPEDEGNTVACEPEHLALGEPVDMLNGANLREYDAVGCGGCARKVRRTDRLAQRNGYSAADGCATHACKNIGLILFAETEMCGAGDTAQTVANPGGLISRPFDKTHGYPSLFKDHGISDVSLM